MKPPGVPRLVLLLCAAAVVQVAVLQRAGLAGTSVTFAAVLAYLGLIAVAAAQATSTLVGALRAGARRRDAMAAGVATLLILPWIVQAFRLHGDPSPGAAVGMLPGPLVVWPAVEVRVAAVIGQMSLARGLWIAAVAGAAGAAAARASVPGARTPIRRLVVAGAGTLAVSACAACVPLFLVPLAGWGGPSWDPTAPAWVAVDAGVLVAATLATRPAAAPARRRSHRLPAAAAAAVLLLPAAAAFGDIPRGESPDARDIHDLYTYVNVLGLSVLIVFEAALVWLAIRYRDRGGAGPSDRRPNPRMRNVAFAAWIAVPSLILVAVAVPSVQLFNQLHREPTAEYQVKVTGSQFSWTFEHPNGTVELDRLHLPAGRPVVLHVTSSDVIHSLYVADLALKVDAIPGRTNAREVTPLTPGVYPGHCTEYCGIGHPRMAVEFIIGGPAP